MQALYYKINHLFTFFSTTHPGIPTTVVQLATSFRTTAFAPILAFLPIVILPSTLAPLPIKTPDKIVGCLFLVFSFPVPPKVTPWNIVTSSWIIAVSPITTPKPWSINKPLLIVAPGWISIPVLLFANSDINLAKKYSLCL